MNMKHLNAPTARTVSSLVGSIMSMRLALGPVTRMQTRALYECIKSVPRWDSPVSLSSEASLEVEFWFQCLGQFNGQPMWPISPDIKITVYLDASDQAWRGYCVKVSNSVAKGSFTQEEAEESSTFRELRGTYYVLSSLVKEVRGNVVRHRTDILNVVRVLSVSSRKPALQHAAIRTFQFCLEIMCSYILNGYLGNRMR